MELEKFDRQLRLMVLLTQNTSYSVEDICKTLSMSRRTIYRYLDAFRQMGFIVEKKDNMYRIDKTSPFFRQITELIHFTEDEAFTISQVLNSVFENTPQIRSLRQKLSRLYDYNVLKKHTIDDRCAQNLHNIYEAIKQERVVMLRDYSSPHSDQKSDRIVEPYMFNEGNTEVRCYELSSGLNKTFKVARIGKVELLDLLWNNKEKHKAYISDLFHFNGERTFPVTLRLGRLAANILVEEFPESERMLKLEDDGRCLFQTEVCSYKGIGRFVLGLLDDIEVVNSPDFENYLRERIRFLTQKISL